MGSKPSKVVHKQCGDIVYFLDGTSQKTTKNYIKGFEYINDEPYKTYFTTTIKDSKLVSYRYGKVILTDQIEGLVVANITEDGVEIISTTIDNFVEVSEYPLCTSAFGLVTIYCELRDGILVDVTDEL